MTRGQQSRAAHSTSVPVLPPGKELFRISEVCELTGTKAHVLRYWESEFPTLRPGKNDGGHRVYRRDDLQTVFEIKRLLYEEGFTIAGARKLLENGPATSVEKSPEPSSSTKPAASPTLNGQHLRAIKRELQGILTILSS